MIHGLTRARGFTQDDSHIYCTQEQMRARSASLLQFVLDLLRDYGLDDFYLELSTRNPDKSIGSDEDWEQRHRRPARGRRGQRAGTGARPGRRRVLRAKISVQVKDAIGRTWQMSTIQVDLMEPELFEPRVHREPTAAASSR